MANLAKLYTDATRLPKEVKEDNSKESEDSKQQSQANETFKLNWLGQPQTKDFFEKVEDDINNLLHEAVNLAVQYPQTNNHDGIVNRLVRVDTLRKVLEYGRKI